MRSKIASNCVSWPEFKKSLSGMMSHKGTSKVAEEFIVPDPSPYWLSPPGKE
jgi:hypothetical protein